MKPHPDDPRLTSHLLGELPPDEAVEIERAAAANPSLKVALDDLARVQRLLGETLGGESSDRLHPWQREAIRRAAADADAAEKVIELPSRRRSWRPAMVVAASVALICGATWMMWRLPSGAEQPESAENTPGAPDWSDPKTELALLPMPGPSGGPEIETGVGSGGNRAETAKLAESQHAALRDDPGGFLKRIGKTLRDKPLPPPSRLRSWPERPPIDARKSPTLRLPLIAGDFSHDWIRQALLERHTPPPPGAVRIEELVNHFPHTFARRAETDGVTLSVESIRTPWDADTVLTMISLKTEPGQTRRVSLRFDSMPAASGIVRYRLLGFDRAAPPAPPTPAGTPPPGALLPGGHRIALVVESWTAAPAGNPLPASVAATVETAAGPKEIRLDASPALADWENADADARLAALNAGFGLWLRKSKFGAAPPPDLLANLADDLAENSDGATKEAAEELRRLIAAAREH
jgi:hypothetical protein